MAFVGAEKFLEIYITHIERYIEFFVIQQKNTNGNIETKLLIIIPINTYTLTYK